MKHNKKRNIGIIYELLLRHISQCLIEDDKKSATKALRIVEKRFHKDTELYKEFRLFNALVKADASTEHVALDIIREAKEAIRRCDSTKLNKEKSRLIKDINHIIEDKDFYYRQIPDYRDYGTIQVTLDEWKKGDRSNLKSIIDLEEKLVTILVEKKHVVKSKSSDPNVTDKLVMNLMTEKLNSRYNKQLNVEQKQILSNYSLYCNKNNHSKMRDYLVNLKEQTCRLIKSYKNITDSDVLKEKIDSVISKVDSLDTDSINDDLVSKFMIISKLKYELIEGK